MKVWLIRDILGLSHGGPGKDCAFLVFLVGDGLAAYQLVGGVMVFFHCCLWFCGGVCIFVWSLFTPLSVLGGVVGGGVV